jgi:acyl-CoA synthetase (AMP-forming)/AMP-acid ligase II
MHPPADYCTLIDALLAASPERPFITSCNDDVVDTVTFGQFVCLAKVQAVEFHERGLRSGDRVILILPQGISLMSAFAGAMMLGAVPAILAYPNFKVNPEKFAAGLTGVTKNLQARLVVVDDEFPSELLDHITMADDARLVRMSTAPLAYAEPSLPRCSFDPREVAFIQHSAGTTGLQKGVALSHVAVLTQLRHMAVALKITHEDRIYSWLPLYHDMGLIACFMLPLVYHLPIVMQSPMEWVVRRA